MPAAVLQSEIDAIALVLANRYAPNGSFAELCDALNVEGRSEQRAFWADLTRYQANLYTAKAIQAIEGPTGGIGMLDVRFNDNGRPASNGWGFY